MFASAIQAGFQKEEFYYIVYYIDGTWVSIQVPVGTGVSGRVNRYHEWWQKVSEISAD